MTPKPTPKLRPEAKDGRGGELDRGETGDGSSGIGEPDAHCDTGEKGMEEEAGGAGRNVK